MNCPASFRRGNKNNYQTFGVVASFIFLILSTTVAFAATGINRTVNFQGKVVNKTAGTNVADGNYNFTFRIYNATSNGTLLWTENYNNTNGNQLTVTSGVFRVALGSVCSFSGGSCQGNSNTGVDFTDDSIYLDITFNGETMGSRVQFTAAPYAFYAEKVAGLSFENNESISNGTDGTIFLGRNDAGTVTLSAKDDNSTADFVIKPGGAASLTLGDASTTGLTVVTDSTGDNEVILPTGSISSGEFLDASLLPVDLNLTTADSAGDEECLTYESSTSDFEWQSCGSGINYWQFNNGALAPIASYDLLLGATATTSAKVAFLNVATGTPTASISANAGNNALYLTGDGTLATTNRQRLVLGNSSTYNSTGDILVHPNGTGILGIGLTNPSNKLHILTTTSNDGIFLAGATSQDISIRTNLVNGAFNPMVVAGDRGIFYTGTASDNPGGGLFLGPWRTGGAGLRLDEGAAAVLQGGLANGKVALAVNQVGNVGNDIFTASAAGITKFTIKNNGRLTLESGYYNSSCTALETNANGDLICGSDDTTPGGPNLWQQNAGAISPFSLTADINFGATATTSAKISLAGSLTRGKALAIFNQTENQDIIAASVAGVTKFVVDKDGRVGVGTQTVTGTTERILQVGSETNRGNSATYGDIVTKGYSQIRSLANIRDVFIYDTSLDSDGGRWIDWATTDKLSWHEETLDDSPSDTCSAATDDRCYSDSFPRKAILVVTTNALYIFDATNGQMWMKFGQNAAGWALGVDTNNDPSSVTAMNGVIYVGTNGSAAGGLYAFDFISDRMWQYDDVDRASANVGIGSRNDVVTYASDSNTNFDLATVGTIAGWKTINDVSVAVVQNSATAISTTQGPGNGATVIGLATDSGLTTINLSTQRVRQFSDATDNDYNSVVVTRGARLYGLNSALDQLELWINIDIDNIATRVNGTPDKVIDETSAPALSKGTPVINTNAPDALDVIPNGSMADAGILATATVPANSDLIYVGHSLGLTEIHLANYTNATTFTGWSKFYNTTRQSPLMPGTIRRYHSMDDASGNVTNDAKTSILTPKGTPTYRVQGVRNRAMSFNGTSQYLCSDNNADGTCDNDTTDNINTGGFTFTVWFKHATAIAGTDVLFARCYNTTPAAATGCIAAAMNSTGQMVFTMDDDAAWTIGAATNNDVTYTTTRTYNDNQWHFLSFSKTNGAVAPVALIDGQVISYATSLTHTTMDNGQILGIGTDCSQGAACGTGGNFWDGQIDDFTYSACGSAGCTTDGLLSTSANAAAVAKRLYTDARPMINKKVITVSDATTASSTTIGDSGESWIPNEFAGQVVALTGGQGAGQTRRIISNTTNTLTVAPSFVTTPDTTTDFEIDPQALIGVSDNVTAVGVTKANPIGESRVMCAGTNSGADTGAVTCYNHQAGPNIVADTYHTDAGYTDDSSISWTGTGFDDIQSIDVTNRAWVLGSSAHTWTETQDVRLGNALDYFQGKVVDIRTQMQVMGTTTLAGQIGLDVGLSGGADVAEFYEADETLMPGNIVAVHPSIPSGVQMSSKEYQKNILGVVATNPGLTLGVNHDRAYPIALTGRVPVIVTTKNGEIKQGDGITSSEIQGVGVRAARTGTIIGLALEGSTYWDNTRCELVASLKDIEWPEDDGSNTNMPCYRYMDNDEELFIGKLMVFVNVGYHQGDELIIPEVIEDSTTQKVMQAFLEDADVKALSMNEKGEIIITNSKGQEIAKVDQNGNMQISGDLVTQKISLTSIDGIDAYAKRIEMLEEKVASLSAFSNLLYTSQEVLSASDAALLHTTTRQPVLSFEDTKGATIAGKLRVKGTSLFEEFVHVIDTLMTKNFIVNGIANFFGKATFKEDIEVQGKLSVGRDTSGIAILKKGTDTVTVTFLSEYDQTPMVTTSITLDTLVDESADIALREEQEKVQAALEEAILNGDIQYVVTRKSKKGFVIKINKAAPEDIQFTWTALGVSKENESVVFVSPGVSDVLGEGVGSISTSSAMSITPGIPLTTAPEEGSKTVTILENELGYLRVREAPRSSTSEIGQVLPGESYKVLEADNGWFKIGYASDKTGWVSSLYVKVTY